MTASDDWRIFACVNTTFGVICSQSSFAISASSSSTVPATCDLPSASRYVHLPSDRRRAVTYSDHGDAAGSSGESAPSRE